MKLNIAVLPGDGIGPEIIEQALRATKAVCQKFGHNLLTRTALVGAVAIDQVGETVSGRNAQYLFELRCCPFWGNRSPPFR